MNSDDNDNTSERPLSELCVNLEDEFINMQDASKGECLNVYARIRPMLNSEIEAGYKECVGLLDEQIVRAVAPASSSKFKMSSHLCQDIIEDFTFTAAYGPETGQFVFFQDCMMDTIKNFIEGQNSLVFSYGTTGSGKTFTLQGNGENPGIIPIALHLFFASIEDQLLDKVFFKPDKFSGVVALNENEIKKELELKEQLLSSCNQGEWNFKSSSTKSLGMLLCRTFSDHFEGEGRQTTLAPEEMAQAQAAALMKEISKKSAENQSGNCSVWISFAEIYNESVFDLLQPNFNQRAKLNLGEDQNGDVYVKGLREVCVSNSNEALSLLNFGQRNLRIASTKLNYQSSRSHCIFTVKVIRIPDLENMTYAKVNKLSFCDLAGSERAAKSQTTGLRLKEAGCINTSLLVLGRCLEQLRLKPSLRDKKLIPFRESKLTRLFSGFFTGRGKAVMISNASPCELTFDETLHVLRFSAIAKELIINDSYITTASNTLQSIANMWTDSKANCKNLSVSSAKSISFEDSMDEVVQEKDELIEKLLDLAESLRNNLEREKKDKAELEIKIRQDVCVEYSEYRDEILAMQKQAFQEERDAIKDIYEKRISCMEKLHEKIITDYKSQLEDSFTSEDEVSKNSIGSPSSLKQFEMAENAIANEDSENAVDVKDSRNTEEELQRTIDYSLSLETEIEHLRKEYENVQLLLENTTKENNYIKTELNASKIDVIAFKTDNESLLKIKSDLEADLKEFREDLVTVTEGKEALFQELEESKNQISSLNDEKHNLLKSINDLNKENEELKIKHKKSLEEAHMKNDQLKEQLHTALMELEAEKKKSQDIESAISTMEMKISELQTKEQENTQLKSDVEILSKDIDELRNENNILKEKLDCAEASVATSYDSESQVKGEIENIKLLHMKEIEKLNISLKKLEAEANEAEEILKSVNKVLSNSQEVIEDKNKELNSLRDECASLKNKLSEELSLKEDIEEKLESLAASFDLEKNSRSDLIKELESLQEQVAKFNTLQSDYFACKNEVISLKNTNLQLEEQHLSASKDSESEISFRQQLQSESKKLEEAFNTINSQKIEIEALHCESQKYLDELADFRKVKIDLENKLDSIALQNESETSLRQQLESESKKLEESLNTINWQKNEIETLKCENKKILNEQANLERVKSDLEDKLDTITSQIDSEVNFRQQLEDQNKKLVEALNTINSQKSEIETLSCENKKYADELVDIKKVKSELDAKLGSIASEKDKIQDLVQVLENCEIEAAHKINEMQSNLQELKEELQTSSVKYKQEYAVLHELIDILEKCEAFASNKIKQFHSTCIQYVEQIMDLERSMKTKETVIDVQNSDIIELQKKLKDLEKSSKKQLQAEIQKFKSESEKMDTQLTDFKKLNESLKCDLAKLEAEKDELENEYKNLKEKKEFTKKAAEEENCLENKTPEKRTSRSKKNQEDERSKKTAGPTETNIENKKQKPDRSKNQEDERRNRKSAEQPETNNENKKQKTGRSKEDKRNKKAAERSENVTDNKKQRTEIYEETDENSSNENERQVKRIGRRHLRCMSNIANEQDLVQKKDEGSSMNKTSKRKADVTEKKSPEKNLTLKRSRMHNVSDAENIFNKPENLRIKLLKCSVNVNDIALPSPRMTRGRKRLVLAKENVGSPRSVRS